MKLDQEQAFISNSSDSDQNVKSKNGPDLRCHQITEREIRMTMTWLHTSLCWNNLIISLYYVWLLLAPSDFLLSELTQVSHLNFTIQFSSSQRPRAVVYFAFMSLNIDYYSVGRRPSETEVITHVRCRWLSSSHWSITKLSSGLRLSPLLPSRPSLSFSIFLANQNIIPPDSVRKKDKTRCFLLDRGSSLYPARQLRHARKKAGRTELD